jgi:hypothetical protein
MSAKAVQLKQAECSASDLSYIVLHCVPNMAACSCSDEALLPFVTCD